MSIRTSDILLRKPTVSDAPMLLEMMLDPEVQKWNPAAKVVDLPSATAWCDRYADWSIGNHATFHAIDEPSGRLLASVSLHAIEKSSRTARIGYRVAPWARRQGVGRTTVDAVARWSFDEFALEQIVLVHDQLNFASCKLAVSARFEGDAHACSIEKDVDGIEQLEHVHVRVGADEDSEIVDGPRFS